MTIEEALNRFGDEADYLEVIKSHRRETMPLFEIAIIEKDKDGNETLKYGPKAVIATTAETAKIVGAIQARSEDAITDDVGKLTILSRSFA